MQITDAFFLASQLLFNARGTVLATRCKLSAVIRHVRHGGGAR